MRRVRTSGIVWIVWLLILSQWYTFPVTGTPSVSEDSSLHGEKSIFLYTHDLWQTENGLPQNSVSAILQTRDGRLWLGTLEGLVLFDGTQFSVRNTSNTLALHSNRILSLQEDKFGRLWVGTEDGGATCFEGNHSFHVGKENGLATDGISALGTDPSGAMWIGTGVGLYRYSNGSISSFTTRDGLQSNAIKGIAVGHGGELYVANAGGVAKFQDGAFVRAFAFQGKDPLSTWAIHVTRDGSVWVSAQDGLFRYLDGTTRKYTTREGLSSVFIWSLGEDAAGHLLVGTHGAGMDIFEDDRFVNYSTKEGLSSPFIWSIFTDREGSIWIGTNGGGLNRLKDDTFTAYTEQNGIHNNFVWSVTEDLQHNMWIGTYDGLDRLAKGKITHFSKADGLKSTFIWSVYADKEGIVWVGTTEGLYKFDGRRLNAITKQDGLSSSAIRSLYSDRKGVLWVGTANGISTITKGRISSFASSDTLAASNVVMSIAEDYRGGMWFGTNGGLIHLSAGKFDTLTRKDGLESDIVRAIRADTDGTIWIGTQGGGLSFLREGKISTITKRHGLYDDVISVILEDDAGALWMSCNNGVFSVQKSELFAFAEDRVQEVHCVHYDRGDGMSSRECNGSSQPAGWRADDGSLWFPTIRGVVSLNPRRIHRNLVPPPIVIEKLISKGTEFRTDSLIHLPAGTRELEIHYAGLSFRAPEKMQFEYILDGFDQKWSQVGGRRIAYFTNIPPGSYTFRVVASNNDGVWNTHGDYLNIVIEPFLYQRPIFQYLTTILLFGVAVSAVGLRIRRHKVRERELTKLVDERTLNLKQEKERAESALNEAQVQRRRAEDANSFKTELLGIAAHDMKSPLIAIRMFSDILAGSTGLTDEAKGFSGDIHTSAQRLLDLINELLESSAIESGTMQLHPTAIEFGKLAASVLDEQVIHAERKGQALRFEAVDDGWICVDEQRTRQVLTNLVNNAIKYSARDTEISVTVFRHGNAVRCAVTDKGPGLSESDVKKLFGRFQRLTPRPTDGEPSTGLGLSIVKKLVEMQSGTVWGESQLGRGTTFIVEFPEYKKD